MMMISLIISKEHNLYQIIIITHTIQGCVDEHPRCEDWARLGQCVKSPKFMTHTCRESCGVCGFLSPANKEEQVVSEKSYTDINKEGFECGQYKRLCEIEDTPALNLRLLPTFQIKCNKGDQND